MSTKPLPREIVFVKILFWIGLIVGAIMLVIGVLGLVTGLTINMLGGGSVELKWLLNFLGFGLVETFFCTFVLVVMRQEGPEIPESVVKLIWYLTIATLGISVARFLVKSNPLDVFKDFLLEWLLIIGFYLYISSVFRFMDSVGNYYGRTASLSRFDWVNLVGRRLAGYLQRR